MRQENKRYTYDAPILRQDTMMRYHYFPVPESICSELVKSGHKRVIVEIRRKTIRRAIQSSKSNPSVILGMPWLRDLGISLGDIIEVSIWSDPASDHVDIGEELKEVLRQDPEASERFYNMTIGQQRSLAYYVTSAKRVDTRIKRALEIAHKLRTRTLQSDR